MKKFSMFFVGALALFAGTGMMCSCDNDEDGGDPDIPEYVDLGLPSGTKWATCNVGADSPEQHGDYFAWGETTPKTNYAWSNYEYCNGTADKLTKYCSNSEYGFEGFTDELTELLPVDDAATVNKGNDWRTPTKAEWQELVDNCTWTWTTQNGVSGFAVIGSNGKSIFLPAAGYYEGENIYDANYCEFWSSSLDTYTPFTASNLYSNNYNNSAYYTVTTNWRSYGYPVRPVKK